MIHKTTRSILSVLLAALLLVTSTPLTPAFAGEGGAVSLQSESGESEGLKPVNGEYQISTAEDLREFAKLVNGGKTTADAVLTADIDLNPDMKISEDGTVTNGKELDPWTPIGTSRPYSGTFDGNGKTISGLYINDSSADYQGLFGYVDTGGTVKDLGVSGSVSGGEDVGGIVGNNFSGTVTNCAFSGSVSGSGNRVGGVVGLNGGNVTGCYNTGKVTGNSVGGVVGDNISSVTNCYNTGKVSGNSYVGGVVGENSDGSVTNCYNTGKVSGNSYVGGVVGYNNGPVKNCYNTGEVSGTDDYVGGVVGQNHGGVTNCYNTGKVTGNRVGGVVGDNRGPVTNCYNTGAVNSSGNSSVVGGVVGDNGDIVINCYNTGAVNSSGNKYVGGVVGDNGDIVTGCYFLKGTAGSGIGAGSATGATAVDNLTAQDQFKGWDFIDTWRISQSLGFPVLQDNAQDGLPPGLGTEASPYEISTADELENFRDLVNDGIEKSAHAKLMNDIDLNGSATNQWTPIGTSNNPYSGTFDGNGKTIKNLYIKNTSSANDQGLFGYVYGGTVQNLSVSGTVSGGMYVGGVVGDNRGNVENCYNTCSVSGPDSGTSNYVGGVVGYNGGSVTNCYNTGSVSGPGNRVGGVAGDNNGNVENCYNTGTVNVSGNSSVVGGVVGKNQGGSVQNCYNTGGVNVTGTGNRVGGVVGWNIISGNVKNCYNTGSVSGPNSGTSNYVGGVVGYNDGASVTNCYFLQTADVNKDLRGIGENVGSGDATATAKDNTAFHSGEVAYLLGEAWGQSALGTKDSLPTLVALDKDAKPVYKVVFISDNTEIEAQYANSGMTVGSPTTNPTKEGYTFAGWFTESSGGSQWNFSDPVTENMTLYAQWTEITPDPEPTPTPTPDPEPSGPSTGDSTGWDDILDELENTAKGDQITIDMGDETKVPAEIFESLAGKDVEISFDLGDDLSWTVNGKDIPDDAALADLDLGVALDTDGIPANVINTITGEVGTVQITLAHDGEFGFTMTLTAPLGKENAGYWANLYHYDEDAEALNFEAAAKIDEDGSVTIPFSHASQYAIVIDTHGHAAVDVSDLFIDIARDAWYKDAVQYAYDQGLMTGVSDTEFAPEATTTRAMIVSILARLEGVESAEAAGFADVNDEWYATAVNWAANVGVVNGYEDNTFRPNTAITREQLAAMLMNYASYKGQDVSARASLDNYTDQPSTWAEETMSWAVAEGLITGVTNDELQPQGNATRAQVAAILQRLLEA